MLADIFEQNVPVIAPQGLFAWNTRISPALHPIVEQQGATMTYQNDPNVWSGRASQEVFAELAVCGLASMYPAFDWSVLCSWPSWISARVRSH